MYLPESMVKALLLAPYFLRDAMGHETRNCPACLNTHTNTHTMSHIKNGWRLNSDSLTILPPTQGVHNSTIGAPSTPGMDETLITSVTSQTHITHTHTHTLIHTANMYMCVPTGFNLRVDEYCGYKKVSSQSAAGYLRPAKTGYGYHVGRSKESPSHKDV